MLERVRTAVLSAAERRVADQLLQRPHAFVQAAIADIARRAAVSEPTVIRFARSLGCSGLPELKLKLAGSLLGAQHQAHAEIAPGDGDAEIAAKVFDNAVAALIECRNAVSAQALEQAIERLAAARRIEFHGLGNSGIVAADAQHKFFRYGIAASVNTDSHVQAMAASLLGPDDVLLAISTSGRTVELLDAVDIALAQGCCVVALTAAGSPLARRATVAVMTPGRRGGERDRAALSRLLQLTLIDVLAVGVALRRGPALIELLERTKRSLHARRRGAAAATPPEPMTR